MIKPSSFMYTLECIRPCQGGKRAIATCSVIGIRTACENTVVLSTGQDIRQRPIKKHKRKRRIEETKCVCLSTKKDSKIHHRQLSKKRTESDRQRKSLPPQLILQSFDDVDIDLFLFFQTKIFLSKMETKYYCRCFIKY